MATPVVVTQKQLDNLTTVFNYALTNYELKQPLQHGLIVVLDKRTNRTTIVHWYEITMDVLLTALAKKTEPDNWKVLYCRWVADLVRLRLYTSDGRHLIDFAYEKYQNLINNEVKPLQSTT